MNDSQHGSAPLAERPAIPNVPLLQRLQNDLESYSSADRAVAAYMLAHYATLAFETAMSLAEKVGVSEITIGRFARKLGYRNFKALKNELKDSSEEGFPWLIGDELLEFVESADGSDDGETNIQREMKSLLAVYRLAETPQWAAAVELLAKSRTVQIAGFQTERGIAMLLANHLQFMRDGVRLVDLSAGNYADVFASDEEDSCLVVIDIRRYSRQSYLIAEQASLHGVPLIVLTDLFCDWAGRFTPHVLAVPTQTGLFWSSPVALVCAVNLMVNSVIKAIGTRVEQRLEKLTRLHQTFTGYAGHQPPRPKMS
ncbi:MurR/RpiR family transcriptional regulator [Sphingopyxis witflariensis]|uniref:RpiR family transcriptional regulator n=1 Tax=Sphingopyxis witflariensis TaxID=173675 RepID=A0A246JYD6_9SPHN|nr:MurR/RpiR family transcriptional regulator [Sphingopyxis witflariensis]OWQ98182.1 RpiR family transcriptional regulator [Sphingopyxis witflariensis]